MKDEKKYNSISTLLNRSTTVVKTTLPLLKIGTIILIYGLLTIIQAYSNNLALRLIISLMLGVILAGCLNLAHECLHETFMGKKINRWVGRIFSGLILINFTLYKEHHLKHHTYVGTEKDTETNTEITSLSDYLIRISGWALAKKKILENFAILDLFRNYQFN